MINWFKDIDKFALLLRIDLQSGQSKCISWKREKFPQKDSTDRLSRIVNLVTSQTKIIGFNSMVQLYCYLIYYFHS